MVRLVLNGSQRGALWEDGRCSDMGIKPFAPGFAAWYLRWLSDPGPVAGVIEFPGKCYPLSPNNRFH